MTYIISYVHRADGVHGASKGSRARGLFAGVVGAGVRLADDEGGVAEEDAGASMPDPEQIQHSLSQVPR